MKILSLIAIIAVCMACTQQKDILLIDFDDGIFGEWTAEGKAFGVKPISCAEQEDKHLKSIPGVQGNYFISSSFSVSGYVKESRFLSLRNSYKFIYGQRAGRKKQNI